MSETRKRIEKLERQNKKPGEILVFYFSEGVYYKGSLEEGNPVDKEEVDALADAGFTVLIVKYEETPFKNE